ncbi:hypothetical protein ACFP65_00310 [Marinilactibacillus sp. GCM10026970]|uniref:hypothetical protein n=1 Tax=Marinilactibacillus sp. GCM10026970 TaxID=3252642 RepID=UPI00361F509D
MDFIDYFSLLSLIPLFVMPLIVIYFGVMIYKISKSLDRIANSVESKEHRTYSDSEQS